MDSTPDTKLEEVTVYIFYPNDTDADYYKDVNQLGYTERKRKYLDKGWSYHNEFIFYPNRGFDILSQIIQRFPQKIELIRIKNSKNKNYTVEKFLNILQHCTIRK